MFSPPLQAPPQPLPGFSQRLAAAAGGGLLSLGGFGGGGGGFLGLGSAEPLSPTFRLPGFGAPAGGGLWGAPGAALPRPRGTSRLAGYGLAVEADSEGASAMLHALSLGTALPPPPPPQQQPQLSTSRYF